MNKLIFVIGRSKERTRTTSANPKKSERIVRDYLAE